MNLQAVITCVNYADFLAETLPHNQGQFDRLVVVTSPEDIETQQVCDYWDVDVVKTDAFRSRWGEFHKARGINAGLDLLVPANDPPDSWVVHLDADIALPPRTRSLLDRAGLDRSLLYGADRASVPNWTEWRDHLAMPAVQTDGYHVRLERFPLVPRFNAWHLRGYAPVGYFQLWHPKVSGILRYPGEHNGADRTDVLFAANWAREKRALIPEFAVYHLESEPHPQGINWGGRLTARFGPQPSQVAKDYTQRRFAHHRHHPHHGGYDPDDKRWEQWLDYWEDLLERLLEGRKRRSRP